MQTTERDVFLDYLRGLAIVWVVFTHVYARVALFTSLNANIELVLNRFGSFEMPLFFFVSGASLYISHGTGFPPGPFMRGRLWRLLVPLVSLMALTAALYSLTEVLNGHALTLAPVLLWQRFQPWPDSPAYILWYIWFVPIALLTCLVHPLLARGFASDRWRTRLAVLLILAIFVLGTLSRPITDSGKTPLESLPLYVAFYSAFIYLGFYYGSRRLALPRIRLLIIAAAAFDLLFVLAKLGVVSSSAATNKFPPNAGYGLLGLTWICLLLAIRPAILSLPYRSRFTAGLRFCAHHSYTIYLFQAFAFWPVDLFLPRLRSLPVLSGLGFWSWVGLYFCLSLPLVMLIAWLIDNKRQVKASFVIKLSRRLSSLFPFPSDP